MNKRIQIALVGNDGVGKDAIGRAIQHGQAGVNHESSIAPSIFLETKNIGGEDIKLKIMSIPGHERFKSYLPMYVKDAEIVLFVYDITNQQSFANLQSWLTAVNNVNKDCVKMIVGNKTDLEDLRTVSQAQGEAFAKMKNAVYTETSAKTGTQIQECVEAALLKYQSSQAEVKVVEDVALSQQITNYLTELSDKAKVSSSSHGIFKSRSSRGIFKDHMMASAVRYLQGSNLKDIPSIADLIKQPIPKSSLALSTQQLSLFNRAFPGQENITLKEIIAYHRNAWDRGDTNTSKMYDPEVIKRDVLQFLNKEIARSKGNPSQLTMLRTFSYVIANMRPPKFASLLELCNISAKDLNGKEYNFLEVLREGNTAPFQRFCKEFKLSEKDAEKILTHDQVEAQPPTRSI
ncbi:MAG: GTP-binding protein [Pseudomonadota bacterium]|nr:GTP-binding protein [Pseudomonadota bacterium]